MGNNCDLLIHQAAELYVMPIQRYLHIIMKSDLQQYMQSRTYPMHSGFLIGQVFKHAHQGCQCDALYK